jgi:hypothetical protein
MKQRRQFAVLAALLVVAIVIWWLYFRGERPVVTADNPPITQSIRLLSVENPQLHWSELDKARKTEYKGTGRNPFSAISTASAPLRPGAAPARTKPPFEPSGPKLSDAQPPPPPPCVLPPNMKFFGYGTVPNSRSRRAFFSNGEDIYVVTEGEILLNQYRILKINNTNLEFEQVSSRCTRATAPLVEQPSTAAAAGPTP